MGLQKAKQCQSTLKMSNHIKKIKSNIEYVAPDKYICWNLQISYAQTYLQLHVFVFFYAKGCCAALFIHCTSSILRFLTEYLKFSHSALLSKPKGALKKPMLFSPPTPLSFTLK